MNTRITMVCKLSLIVSSAIIAIMLPRTQIIINK